MTSKARKIEFIEHQFALGDAVAAVRCMFAREGLEWFTDEQLADIINYQVDEWKQMRQRSRKNREFYRTHSIMDLDNMDGTS